MIEHNGLNDPTRNGNRHIPNRLQLHILHARKKALHSNEGTLLYDVPVSAAE
jgi:hypothetical protein